MFNSTSQCLLSGFMHGFIYGTVIIFALACVFIFALGFFLQRKNRIEAYADKQKATDADGKCVVYSPLVPPKKEGGK